MCTQRQSRRVVTEVLQRPRAPQTVSIADSEIFEIARNVGFVPRVSSQ
jgi:hypothetical protein